MPVPSDITVLSTTPASNSPPGSETPSSIDDYLRSHASFIAQMRAVIGGAVDANIPSAYATTTQITDQVTNQTQNSGTTAGTLTAYTLVPATALTSYAAGKTFWVTFHVASGASPTLTISGVGTPPSLVKQNPDGTYSAIAAGDIPINHRSRVTLISATQALVESLPSHSDTLNTTRIDVASATTVNLTSSAPNTRHINITGTTTITGFTVAAGQCYFVRFNAALTLTNNANIVTQTGANITTAAGDTCILRATAANVVEVLAFTPFVYPFLREYVSAEQTITAAGALTLAHGLGAVPKLVTAELVCKTAQFGYSINDVVQADVTVDFDDAGTGYGMAIKKTSTNLVVRYGTSGVGVGDATNGTTSAVTPANWRIVLRAWA